MAATAPASSPVPSGSGSGSAPAAGPSLEVLRHRLAALKATRASLRTELAQLKALPSPSKDSAAPAHALAAELAELEERVVLARTAGWTVFQADLAPGRRAKSQGGQVGIGVRMEGFCGGRFHEPHYLLFARGAPPADAEVTFSTLDSGGSSTLPAAIVAAGMRAPLQLVRHTIPSWVPLPQLVAELLPPAEHTDDATGGWDLVHELGRMGGSCEPFLSAVYEHLQAGLHRREAFKALATGSSDSAVEGYASAGHLAVRLEAPLSRASAADAAGQKRSRETSRLRVELRFVPTCDRLGARVSAAPAGAEVLESATHAEGGSVYVQLLQGDGQRGREETRRRTDLEELFLGKTLDDGPSLDSAFTEALRIAGGAE